MAGQLAPEPQLFLEFPQLLKGWRHISSPQGGEFRVNGLGDDVERCFGCDTCNGRAEAYERRLEGTTRVQDFVHWGIREARERLEEARRDRRGRRAGRGGGAHWDEAIPHRPPG